MVNNQFFIKDGYESLTERISFEGEAIGSFWNEDRIKNAYVCQYYVYKESFRLFKHYKYNSLLDVGCGPPIKIHNFFSSICNDVTLVDQESIRNLVNKYSPYAVFIPADLEKINITLNKTFDMIICSDVLEHLIDPNQCVDFIKKHLSKNGIAIFSTPERDILRGPNCFRSPKPEHVREWNKNEFSMYIKNCGFKIIKHTLVPPRKIISIYRYLLYLLFSYFVKKTQWSTCQLVTCKLPI